MSKNTITNPLQKCEKYDKDPLRPADARQHLQKGGAALRSNDGEGLFYFEVLYLLGLLADVSQDAAISVQDLAIDKVGSMGGQEHAGADHVLGGAPAACGGLGGDELVEGVTAAVRLGLAQGSGLERMAKVVTTIHDLVGD